MSHAPELGSLYQAVILDHYRRPRNHGKLEGGNARIHMNNPTCGDEIELSLTLEGDRLSAIRFAGRGCSISQASASMMTELLTGRTVEESRGLAERFKALLRGDAAAAADRSLGNLRALAGVARFPARVRCALLAWNALEEAVASGNPLHESSQPPTDRRSPTP
jgi:nitrogen fixation protein NifU and related proteins